MNYPDYLIYPVRLQSQPSVHEVYFTSDTHFGHNKEFLFGKRGFANVFEHDAALIDDWNKRVTDKDTVIHCGDFMFGEGGIERMLNYLTTLNFLQLYLLPGNHHAGLKQWLKEFGPEYEISKDKVVHIVPNYLEFVVNGQAIVVCHYPIASWNGMGKGVWCVSGHCHGSYAGSHIDNPEGKIIDVGYESAGLVSFNQLNGIMAKKTIKLVDHHGENTSTSLH